MALVKIKFSVVPIPGISIISDTFFQYFSFLNLLNRVFFVKLTHSYVKTKSDT